MQIPDALARLLPTRAQIPAWAHALATRATQQKATRTGPLIAYESLGAPVWSGRDYAAFSREGFMQNAIVYRCVRMISEAAASIPLLLYDGVNELEDHPLLSLLASPSPHQTGTDFLESFIGYLLVSGNTYVEAVGLNGELRELYALRPDRMTVLPGLSGWPEGYEYTAAGGSVRFTTDVVPGVRPILHMRLFHPLDDHYGMSPIEAAAVAIDIHNQASKWNKALLDNAARPSGALVYAAREGRLSPEQFERLKNELQEGFQGAKNAGRPLLLEGGLDWKPLSLTPAELDFVNTKHAAAREIALALGVPPMLLGIPGDNTFSNYAEANRSFWRNTVIPLATRTTRALADWLTPAYGFPLTLKLDLDQIEALAPEREALWTRLEKASFLTDDEKRSAAGYGPKPLAKGNPWHDPSSGQFTTGPGGGSGQTPVAYRPRPPQPPKPPTPATASTPPVKPVAPKPDFLSKRPGSGKITGNVDKLTPAEKSFANEMRDLGNDIEIVPTGEGRTPDFKINGTTYELKTVSGVQRNDVEGLSAAVSSRILDGRGQSGNVIVDARNQNGMSLEAADRAVRRAYGADTKNTIQSITILTPNAPLYVPRRP